MRLGAPAVVALALAGAVSLTLAAGALGAGDRAGGSRPAASAVTGASRGDEATPVRVRIFYSPRIRGVPYWQSEIDRTLERAEDLLADDLEREFELVEMTEWPGGEHDGSLEALLGDLMARMPDADADIVLGLAATGAFDARRGGFFRGRRFETRGLTNYESAYAVVRLQGPIDRAGRLVAHELAHVFGAVHVAGSGLMGIDSTGTQIDSLNRELLRLHRGRSFVPGRFPLVPSRWEAARELYEKAREAADESERGRIELQLAQLEMATGRWQSAADLLSEVTERRPDHVVAWSKLGFAQLRAGNLGAAERATRRALELQPDSYWGLVNLGVILDARGDPDAAAEEFERAIRVNPDAAEAHENLGHVLAASGRHREAMEAYRRVLELTPERADLHRELARAYFHLGRMEEAAEEIERALSLGVPVDRRLVEEVEEALGRPVVVDPDGAAAAGEGSGRADRSSRAADAPAEVFEACR